MAAGETDGQDPVLTTGIVVAVLFVYLGAGVLYVAVRTAFENLAWNHTTIDEHRFESRLRIPRMLGIYIVNIATIACSLATQAGAMQPR